MKNNHRSVNIIGKFLGQYAGARKYVGGRWELWIFDQLTWTEKRWFPVTEPSVFDCKPHEKCITMIHAEVHIKGEFG